MANFAQEFLSATGMTPLAYYNMVFQGRLDYASRKYPEPDHLDLALMEETGEFTQQVLMFIRNHPEADVMEVMDEFVDMCVILARMGDAPVFNSEEEPSMPLAIAVGHRNASAALATLCSLKSSATTVGAVIARTTSRKAIRVRTMQALHSKDYALFSVLVRFAAKAFPQVHNVKVPSSPNLERALEKAFEGHGWDRVFIMIDEVKA